MRTFMGFVNSDGQLYSSYQEGGQTYLEPIGSFSEANSVIDTRSQNTQQESSNNTRIAQQVLDKFQTGSSTGLSTTASGAGTSSASAIAPEMGEMAGEMVGPRLGASSGGGSGGMGAMGYVGIIAAAIAAQHAMSSNTEREFEGVKTDDAFSGNMLTEPWQAYMYQKMGINTPTMGEKFDAAVENKDWGSALRRSAGAFAHDPLRETIYDASKSKWGKTTAAIIDPGSFLLDWIGG